MFLQMLIIFNVFYLYVFKGVIKVKTSANNFSAVFDNNFSTGYARFYHKISTDA